MVETESLSFCFPRNDFISSSLLKHGFSGHFSGWHFFFFCYSENFTFLSPSSKFSAEKSAVRWIGIPCSFLSPLPWVFSQWWCLWQVCLHLTADLWALGIPVLFLSIWNSRFSTPVPKPALSRCCPKIPISFLYLSSCFSSTSHGSSNSLLWIFLMLDL